MDCEIRDAFDKIVCSDKLKSDTYAYVSGKIKRGKLEKTLAVKWAAAVACLMIFIGSGFGGYRIYYTEAATISIDINPSIELRLNRWGRVVQEVSYGKESEEVLSALSLKHKNYEEALDQLLSSNEMKPYLNKNSLVSVTLESENNYKDLLTEVRQCVDNSLENSQVGVKAEYAAVDEHLCDEAHRYGMSVGKYYAIQELLAVDPQATVDEFKDKSMKEIKVHMEHCSHGSRAVQKEVPEIESSSCGNGSGCHGHHR